MTNKNEERIVFHVVPDASATRWIVSRENGDLRKEFDTKQEAEEFAKNRAQQFELSQVKVHKQDGNMEYESTYGKDPERYKS